MRKILSRLSASLLWAAVFTTSRASAIDIFPCTPVEGYSFRREISEKIRTDLDAVIIQANKTLAAFAPLHYKYSKFLRDEFLARPQLADRLIEIGLMIDWKTQPPMNFSSKPVSVEAWQKITTLKEVIDLMSPDIAARTADRLTVPIWAYEEGLVIIDPEHPRVSTAREAYPRVLLNYIAFVNAWNSHRPEAPLTVDFRR